VAPHTTVEPVTRPRLATILVLLLVAGSLSSSPVPSPPAAAAATVSASGDVMAFGPGGGPIDGLTVRVLEQPGLSTVTDGSGHWQIDGIPTGTDATFFLDTDARYPIQGVDRHHRSRFAVGAVWRPDHHHDHDDDHRSHTHDDDHDSGGDDLHGSSTVPDLPRTTPDDTETSTSSAANDVRPTAGIPAVVAAPTASPVTAEPTFAG
jgi:hypothetical protein